MSCPGGTFKKFTKSYLRTLSLFYKEMPEVKVSDYGNGGKVQSHEQDLYTRLTVYSRVAQRCPEEGGLRRPSCSTTLSITMTRSMHARVGDSQLVNKLGDVEW